METSILLVKFLQSRVKLCKDLAKASPLSKAGGHLASLLGMDQDAAVRPNFLALLYPAMPADPLPVTASAPQTFLAHASDDALSADNSIRFYQALRKAKVPAEMHIFSEGGHGFGIRKSGKTSENWPERFAAWFKAMKCACESQ